MLHQVFMVVRSDYRNDVFYQVFLPDDTVFAFPLYGREGWLREDTREVELEVDVQFPQVQVGFRRAASATAEWIAKPVLVSPRKRIVLSREGEILQEDINEGIDPDRLSESTFFNGEVFMTLLKGVGAIPKVGAVVQGLLNLIWPEPSAQSLVDAVERRMRWLIRASVNQLDLAIQSAHLMTARDNLRS